MTKTESRLHDVLSAALVAGMSLGPTGCTQVVGDTPANRFELCRESAHADMQLQPSVDYWSRSTFVENPAGEMVRSIQYGYGEPCASADDPQACTDAFDTLGSDGDVPVCVQGELEGSCASWGYVVTQGDSVQLLFSDEALLPLVLPVETIGDARFAAGVAGYSIDCHSLVMVDGNAWRMHASRFSGSCPIYEHPEDIELSEDGVVTVLKTHDRIDTTMCVGRRPDGLFAHAVSPGHGGVAAHLAHMAWLEGAAVIAFERLASDLRRLGAPSRLAERALSAATDERRHARLVARMARRYGAVVPPVSVQDAQPRSVLELAIENGVEGCVRETFGVVDARYRARHAETPALRRLYQRLADDELRHAALSWDIADWFREQLTRQHNQQVQRAMTRAHSELVAEAEASPRVRRLLGIPSPSAVRAMAGALTSHLAA